MSVAHDMRCRADAILYDGAATVAKLHSNAEFLADVTASRKELEASKAKGPPENLSCDAETAALAAQ